MVICETLHIIQLFKKADGSPSPQQSSKRVLCNRWYIYSMTDAISSSIKRNISLELSLNLSKHNCKAKEGLNNSFQITMSKERLNQHTTTNSATHNRSESEGQINKAQSQLKHTSFVPTTVGMDHIWTITMSWHTSQIQFCLPAEPMYF